MSPTLPPDLNAAQLQSFGHLLFVCARLLDEVAQAEVNRQAGRVVARPALMRLLPHLGTEGIRPSVLARRLDVSKQAVSQALAELQAQGLVEQMADPDDGRAQRVRLTAFGLAAFGHGLGVLSGLEEALACAVGAPALAQTKATLQAMLPVLQRWHTERAEQVGVPAPSQPAATAPALAVTPAAPADSDRP